MNKKEFDWEDFKNIPPDDSYNEEKAIFDALDNDTISKADALESLNRLIANQSPMKALMNLRNAGNYGGPKITMPKIQAKSMEEIHDYASARVLLESLNRYYMDWSKTVDESAQIVIYVVLANGATIQITKLIEEGYNGIGIEGELNNVPCLLLLQQSSLQFICVAEKINADKPRRKIGFIFSD